MTIAAVFRRPFPEQLAFFRGKLGNQVPTEAWDDVFRDAHDSAFMVAGAMKADLLSDLAAAVDRAIADGTGLAAFRQDFARLVQRHGWDYQGGFDWRTQVIYQTNVRTSHAAGRYAQLTDPAMLRARPFWRYVHSDESAHPRPLHLAWNGTTLPAQHPWFDTHFAPNGWGCRCRIVPVRAKDLAPGEPDPPPEDGSYAWTDRHGEIHDIPNGIDPGWDYAPGKSRARGVRLTLDKAAGLEPVLGAAHVESVVSALPRAFDDYVGDYRTWAAAAIDTRRATGELRPVGAFSGHVIAELDARGLLPDSAVLAVRDEDILHALRDSKSATLPEEVWLELPRHVGRPRAVLLERGGPPHTLLLVIDVPGRPAEAGKLVIRINYELSFRRASGGRQKVKLNLVRSGRVVPVRNLNDRSAYELLDGTP